MLGAQFEDGGWNCRLRNYPETVHSSFHTTFNVLENLRIANVRGIIPTRSFAAAERRAVELLLEHHLYRSDHTGAVISERFTQLTYPWHWHYTFLRGLDYLRMTAAISDQRLADTLNLLDDQRKPNGRWPLQKRIPGTLLVEMEKPGQDSRWNTLRALRVLRSARSSRPGRKPCPGSAPGLRQCSGNSREPSVVFRDADGSQGPYAYDLR